MNTEGTCRFEHMESGLGGSTVPRVVAPRCGKLSLLLGCSIAIALELIWLVQPYCLFLRRRLKSDLLQRIGPSDSNAGIFETAKRQNPRLLARDFAMGCEQVQCFAMPNFFRGDFETGIPGLFWLNPELFRNGFREFNQFRPSINKRLANVVCFTPVRKLDLVETFGLPCSVDVLCGNAEGSRRV